MEFIHSEDGTLACIIIKAAYQPAETSFLTEPQMAQQVGFVVYPEGGVIKRHIHMINDRVITGASEALFLRQGLCEIDIYDQQQKLITTRELCTGDFVLMLSGGHGFRILQKTIFMEIKLGPYLGVKDKELFSMIPVNEPLIGEAEVANVLDCLRTGWISSAGKYLEAFEQAWADYCGMRYGIAVSNGTTALHVAIACLGLKPGDEVILPSFTIISCAQAVTQNGGIPVLVDSDPRTWCMDARQLADKITPRTRAIMPVHIYGHPVDMDPVLALAEQHHLAVIEDAAEAHGAEYLSRRDASSPVWRRCGGMSDISVFSFYANKLITTGEGGMLLTNDPEIARQARSQRNLCFRPERRFYHTELGNNFRLTNLQAAIGVAQIERMAEIIAKKRWIGETYTQRLANVPGISLPVEEPWAKQVYWMYGLVLDESTGLTAADFAVLLREAGIETRPFFLGMHEQPVFLDQGLFKDEHYPVAECLARQGLYLPSGLALTGEQIEQVCQAVEKILGEHHGS